MAALLALVASASWGASDFIAGLVSKKNHYLAVTLWRLAVEVLLMAGALVVISGAFRWSDVAWAVPAGLAASVALPLFFKALSEGQMGVVAPIAGTVGAMVPLVVGLAQGERPSALQLGGVLVALVAIALVSTSGEDPLETGSMHITLTGSMLRKDVRSAVISGVGFGAYFSLIAQTSSDSGMWPNMIVILTMAVALLAFALGTSAPLTISRDMFVLNSVGAAFDAVAVATYLLATRHGLLAIVGVLGSLYPAATALLAYLLLKERLSAVQVAGLLAALAALGLVGSG